MPSLQELIDEREAKGLPDMEDFLSQNEIDCLLRGVCNEEGDNDDWAMKMSNCNKEDTPSKYTLEETLAIVRRKIDHAHWVSLIYDGKAKAYEDILGILLNLKCLG
jgi:hypothetical protein